MTSAQQAIPRPIFIDDKDQDVNDHPLLCSICCDVSFQPVITPCQHVFCRDCIESGLQNSLFCPNDRRMLNRNDLRNIGGLHEYIYNRTIVRCPKCENWTGQVQQYKVHAPHCVSSSYVQSLERKLQEMSMHHVLEMANKQATISTLQAAIARDRETLALNAQTSHQNDLEKERLQNLINASQNTISSLESRLVCMGPAFDGNYCYNQYNVLDLSRIISRNLSNRPNSINPNRIFNCLKNCYDASLNGDVGLRANVNMLLATSMASNWFSYNQECRILEWYRNIRS